MKSDLLLLSVYPLSGEYLNSLREKLGRDFEQLTLGELRQHGSIRLLLAVQRIRPTILLLPLEDENSLAILPIVKLLAGFTRAGKIQVIQPNMEFQEVSRLSIAVDVIRFCMASLACLASAALAWIELRLMLNKLRIDAPIAEQGRRVLYLKTNLWFGIKAGGSVGHIAGVVNALRNRGFAVTFASAEPPVMVDSEVEIHKVAALKTFGLPYGLNNYRFQKSFASEAARILSQKGFSLIYQRLSAFNYLGVILSRAFRLPLVVEYNGSEVWIAKHWGRAMRFHKLAAMAEEAMLRHAHLLVTVSEVLRDDLIDRGVEPERIVCYPNCIDPAVFDPQRFSKADYDALRLRYDISLDAVVVAFIGTFGQWHGAEMLAAAIARLYNQEREWLVRNNVHFLLVGDGMKMPEVRSIIKNSGSNSVCTLTGLVPQEQAALHLAAADILVSPHVPNSDGTRFFGSPTKLFEYMAMAKGIIASDLDQIGEVLSPSIKATQLPKETPGENSPELAVLSDPGNLDELVRGLKFLVECRDWREHLGKRARLRALENYTWHHHVAAILSGLEQQTGIKKNPCLR